MIQSNEQAYLVLLLKFQDQYLLTAAHNLVECDGGQRFFTQLKYFSSYNKEEVLDSSSVDRFFFPEDFCSGGSDIAVVKLRKSILPHSSLPFVALPEQELRYKEIRVIGYPADLCANNSPIMYEDTGTVKDLCSHMMLIHMEVIAEGP